MRPRARRQTKAAAPVDIESQPEDGQEEARNATAQQKEMQHTMRMRQQNKFMSWKKWGLHNLQQAITIGCNLKGEAGAKEFVYFGAGQREWERESGEGDRQTDWQIEAAKAAWDWECFASAADDDEDWLTSRQLDDDMEAYVAVRGVASYVVDGTTPN